MSRMRQKTSAAMKDHQANVVAGDPHELADLVLPVLTEPEKDGE
jgi:hypothetical protein